MTKKDDREGTGGDMLRSTRSGRASPSTRSFHVIYGEQAWCSVVDPREPARDVGSESCA